jgi:acetylornithine deacetylase
MRDAGIQPLACIVGEPTSMVPAIAHKGVYRYKCCVRGKEAHSSLTPQVGQCHRDGGARGRQGARHGGRLRARGAALRRLRRAVLDRQRGPVPRRHRRQRGAARRRVPLRIPRPAHRRRKGDAGQVVSYARTLEPAMQKVAPDDGLPLRDHLRDPQLPGLGAGRRHPLAQRLASEPAPRWWPSAPKPASSRTPASAPWSAAPAASCRRTSPTNS